MRIPARLLRLCILSHVTIRSPIPESPENVCGLPPIFTPSLVISAMPLVIRAALVLSPYPRPSAMPAARAMTFLSEPPRQIPSISGLVYTRNTLLMNTFCINSALAFLRVPTTHVVGIPLPTSSAWLGPERTATCACGISSSTTWHNVSSVVSSIPLPSFT